MPPHPWSVEYFTCLKQRTPLQVQRLHAYMNQVGLDMHILLGNQETRNTCCAYQDHFSWNSLISTCVSCGQPRHALTLYQQMHQQGYLHPPYLALLKACIELQDLETGQDFHAEIVRKGLFEESIFVGSTLIDMYVKCGSLTKAQEVFDKLPVQNVISWTTLLAGYADYGEAHKVFDCVEQMQCEGIFPDAFTFVCLLKACGTLAAVEKGREVHVEIVNKGFLEDNAHAGSSLISMYIKFSLLEEAQNVFVHLPVRNVVSWTVLIAGLAEHGSSEEALSWLDQMRHEGIPMNGVTYVCSLKACANQNALDKGQDLHLDIVRKGLEKEELIGNTLIDMYSKCCVLASAHAVFEKLMLRTVVSWNALISGYSEHGLYEEVLDYYEQMQLDGISPNIVTFVCCLKGCGGFGVQREGQEIHAMIVRKGLDGELLISSTLVDMYVKWGSLPAAQEVFNMLLVRDVILWNTLLTGYADYGFEYEVLYYCEVMQQEGVPANAVTFACILKACGSLGTLDEGEIVHAEITKKGLESDLLIANTIIDMYAKCGSPDTAERVLTMLPVRDVVSWNTLVSGYSGLGYGEKALSFVEQMQQDGVSLNSITFACILKSCGSVGATIKGQQIHIEVVKQGLERELFVGSTVVDMYTKCDLLSEAQEAFDKLPNQTIVSWNVLLVGYIERCEGEEALNLLEQMQGKGMPLDAATFVCGLKACGSVRAAGQGQLMHAEITKRGLERELFISNILVDVYVKCGLLADAQESFDKSLARDVVAWTALIAGYFECDHCVKALAAFNQMRQHCISPNAVTFVFVLKACGSIGATKRGAKIHVDIAKLGLDKEPFLGNNLVDMYAKCALLADAQHVFDNLLVRDMVSWNALIAGYAQHGESENVFMNFNEMVGECIKPDSVTFVSVLNVCNHAGLVDQGQMFFEVVGTKYGFSAILEHYTCVIDLLGRAGYIEKVLAMIEMLPLQPDVAMWHSVLRACQKRGLVAVGRHSFEQAVQLDDDCVSSYVCLSNICADAGENEEG